MKQCFRECNFRDDTMLMINRINEIIDTYSGQKITARQLYYQFVVRNWLTNEEKSYKNLTRVASDGRLAGLIDWDAIEDRGREPIEWSQYSSIASMVRSNMRSFRLHRWETQENYVELWVEKQALAGVLQPLSYKWHVPLMVNKGYSSSSAMYESAQRYLRTDGQHPVLLYLGDHDPSGEDMVRDIEERMMLFGVQDIEVRKVALTMEQIKKHKPPPNPAKMTDSRAPEYVAKYGRNSWEVDALPPNVLTKLIDSEMAELVNAEALKKVVKQEEKQKNLLEAALDEMDLEGKEDEDTDE